MNGPVSASRDSMRLHWHMTTSSRVNRVTASPPARLTRRAPLSRTASISGARSRMCLSAWRRWDGWCFTFALHRTGCFAAAMSLPARVSASKDYGPSGSSLTLRTAHPPPFHSNVLKQPLSCGIVSGSPSPASKATSTWRFTASWGGGAEGGGREEKIGGGAGGGQGEKGEHRG